MYVEIHIRAQNIAKYQATGKLTEKHNSIKIEYHKKQEYYKKHEYYKITKYHAKLFTS